MKIDEQLLLEFKMELEELVTIRESMIAENENRKHRSYSMAYTDNCFLSVAGDMKKLREKLIKLGES